MFAVSVDHGSALALGRPRRLSIETLPSAVESGQTYDIDPKSGRFLMMKTVTEQPPRPEVRVMLNGYTDARRGAR